MVGERRGGRGVAESAAGRGEGMSSRQETARDEEAAVRHVTTSICHYYSQLLFSEMHGLIDG